MSLINKIKADLLQARKNRDKDKARLLTTLSGDCMKVGYTVDGVRPPSDSECTAVVKKTVKNLKELIAAKDQRGDSLVVEGAELDILMNYLPKQLDVDQLNTIIEELVFTEGCDNIGAVMKVLKRDWDGINANGKIILTHNGQQIVGGG